MIIIASLIALLCGIASFICWIIVVVKIFQNESVGKGIFAIICGLYALVLGWNNRQAWGIPTVMTIWLIAFLGSIITNVLVNVLAAAA